MRLVARREHAHELTEMLAHATLHGYAAAQAGARGLAGRDVAYAVKLPRSGTPVVVRHNRHGGLLARLTGDLFIRPTRAPYELAVALRLANARIPTPEVLGFAVYVVGPLLRRSDIVTREVEDARDLADVLTTGDDAERTAALEATARLVAALSAAGAWHHDLNAKNVLLERRGDGVRALVLDVDRVTFHPPTGPGAPVVERNLARLLRSARKRRERYGARVSEAELAALVAATRRATAESLAAIPSTRS